MDLSSNKRRCNVQKYMLMLSKGPIDFKNRKTPAVIGSFINDEVTVKWPSSVLIEWAPFLGSIINRENTTWWWLVIIIHAEKGAETCLEFLTNHSCSSRIGWDADKHQILVIPVLKERIWLVWLIHFKKKCSRNSGFRIPELRIEDAKDALLLGCLFVPSINGAVWK